MITANDWIEQLSLKPHPEGGYYREVYRADEYIEKQALPNRYNGDRSFSTAIYYLLTAGEFSAFHRVRSDETWHFYAGGVLEIFTINPQGSIDIKLLGNGNSNASPMHTIPHGSWFAAKPAENTPYTLAGCTVAPGFDFADFELADKNKLLKEFPQHKELISALTL